MYIYIMNIEWLNFEFYEWDREFLSYDNNAMDSIYFHQEQWFHNVKDLKSGGVWTQAVYKWNRTRERKVLNEKVTI